MDCGNASQRRRVLPGSSGDSDGGTTKSGASKRSVILLKKHICIRHLIVVFVDCGLGERCQRCCRGGGGVEKTGNTSKVVPLTMEKQNRIDAAAEKAWE